MLTIVLEKKGAHYQASMCFIPYGFVAMGRGRTKQKAVADMLLRVIQHMPAWHGRVSHAMKAGGGKFVIRTKPRRWKLEQFAKDGI
jgi:hypothetical protein